MTLVTLYGTLAEHAQRACASFGAASEGARRRAVSTSYYALFHLLCHHAVEENYDQSDSDQTLNVFSRNITHTAVYDAACNAADGQSFYDGVARRSRKPSDSVKYVAKVAAYLLEQREMADYDRSDPLDYGDAWMATILAKEAIGKWSDAQRDTSDMTVKLFLEQIAAAANRKMMGDRPWTPRARFRSAPSKHKR